MKAVKPTHDLIVIGGGPAGISAAIAAAAAGARVALIDEQPTPGGQIYRASGQNRIRDRELLGQDYRRGESLLTQLQNSGVEHIGNASVWQASRQHEVSVSVDGRSRLLRGRALILATGALERPYPFPGWTLPGVMTCGAGQILLKSAGVAPATPVVLAGSGPLLFLIAWQFLRARVPIAAIVETTPASNYPAALRHLGGAVLGWRYIVKGLGYLRAIRSAGVPLYRGARQLRASADANGRLAALSFDAKGHPHQLDCQLLMTHQGVVPNTQLSRSLELAHEWDDLQRCWRPTLDAWGESSAKGIFIAGDGAGIGGALAAEHQGRISALGALVGLGLLDGLAGQQAAAAERRALRQHTGVRPFLDRLYQPREEVFNPADETLVCRCEEVTAGQIRGFVRQGCLGPNQTKAFSRSGMGACQGRMCGLSVSSIIAAERGVPAQAVGYYHIRPPIKPITFGELAAMTETD